MKPNRKLDLWMLIKLYSNSLTRKMYPIIDSQNLIGQSLSETLNRPIAVDLYASD